MRTKTASQIIHEPAASTLRRYGLTAAAWERMLKRQRGVCGVCGVLPASGRLVIDHEHVPGWKRLPPEKRATYVRGLTCPMDNHYNLSRSMTTARAAGVLNYLFDYNERRKVQNTP